MKRRSFLKGACAAAVAAAGSGTLSGCAGVVRSDLAPKDQPDGTSTGLEAEDLRVLYAASLAPSGHNTQPWQLRIMGSDEWVLGSERARWLPAVDPENRELVLSLGTFVENLDLAAGASGRRVEVAALSADPKARDLLRLQLRPDRPRPDRSEDMAGRRSVRNGLLGRELAAADVEALSRLVQGGLAYFPGSTSEAHALADATYEANRAQVARNDAQQELADWIRWSDSEARTQRDGLTPESMEIHGLSGWFVRHFYDRHSVLEQGFRRRTLEVVREQVGSGAGWLVLTSAGDGVPDWVETGRRFERLFLALRRPSIAIHPMTQVLEEEPWRSQLASELPISGIPQFVLRVGYLDRYPPPVSLRRPLTSFVSTRVGLHVGT